MMTDRQQFDFLKQKLDGQLPANAKLLVTELFADEGVAFVSQGLLNAYQADGTLVEHQSEAGVAVHVSDPVFTEKTPNDTNSSGERAKYRSTATSKTESGFTLISLSSSAGLRQIREIAQQVDGLLLCIRHGRPFHDNDTLFACWLKKHNVRLLGAVLVARSCSDQRPPRITAEALQLFQEPTS